MTETIKITPELEDRLHIAAMHLELTHAEFITQALEIALNRHENRHGGIMEVKASDKAAFPPAPNQIGKDEQQDIKSR